MRELHVTVPESHVRTVEEILDEHAVDYTALSNAVDGILFVFVVPTPAVDDILDALTEGGISKESYTVTTRAETAETPQFSTLYERYSGTTRKLPKGELHSKIREMQWPNAIYYLGTVLSVLAAAAGLLIDQPALIIGAMVIAPQASSALAAPAGVLLSDWEMFILSIKEQSLGLGLSIVSAALFGFSLRSLGFVPPALSLLQVELVGVRLAPSLLSTVGAIIAGVVGAFSYTTEQSTALVGVMIAAALIPAAAATGLALAWGAPVLAVGAFLLLLVNALAINLGALPTLLALGYGFDWREEGRSLRGSIADDRRVAVYVVVALVAVAAVVVGTLTATNVAFTQSVNQEVQATLDDPAYANLSLSGVEVEYGGALAPAEPSSVTVYVGRPAGRTYPDLAATLDRRIERRTGRRVRVTVQFAETQSAAALGSDPVAAVVPDGPSPVDSDRVAAAGSDRVAAKLGWARGASP